MDTELPIGATPQGESGGSSRTLRLFVLGALTAPLLLLAALAWIDWERLQQESQLRAARTATALAEQALRVFEANAGALARVDERAKGMAWPVLRQSAEFNAFLRGVVSEVRQAESIGLADSHGDLAAINWIFPASGHSVVDQDYFRAHVERDAGIFVGEVGPSRPDVGPKFRLSRRRSAADGGFDGVVFSTVTPTALTDFYRSIADPGDSVTLARADGAVLARFPDITTGLRTLPQSSGFMRSVQEAPQGGFYRTASHLDGVDRLHAFAPVGGYPVYVSYGLNPAVIARRWRGNLLGYGLVAVLSSLLLALVGAAALRSAGGERRALGRAKAAAEASARAETELSRAREREARDAAEASEARFRKLVEANILPMAFGSFDGRIVEANDAFLGMIGYARRELVEGRLRWDALTPPEHRHLDEAARKELLATGKAKPFEKEYIARDGRRVPILIAGVLLAKPYSEEQLIATYYVDLTAQQVSAQALERERSALAESEARLRAIFDSAPVGLAFAEAPSGRIIGGNGALERIVGHPLLPSGSVAEYREWFAHHADGRPLAPSEYPLARALAGEEAPTADILYERGDGRRAWISVTAAPIRDAAGEIVGGVVTLVDIDRERRALEDTRRLVDELNHRVKNTLAAVQSMAHQTLRTGVAPEQARQAFESRLMALSAAHNVLTSRNWRGVELPDMLQAIAGTHAGIAGRWRSQGPCVNLEPRMALPLALAFHELFSNARRHGALAGPQGEVVISWIVRNGGGGGSDLDIEWRETGGPPVAPPGKIGFGTRMLKRSLALELEGVVDVTFAETGLVCRIRAPLRAAAGRVEVA